MEAPEKRGLQENVPDENVYSPQFSIFHNILKRQKSSMSLSAVFSATEIICSTLAEIPILVKRIGQNGKKEIDTENPISIALNNALISKFTMIKCALRDMYISGNGFIYIKRSRGIVTGLQYCPVSTVTINYNYITQKLFYTVVSEGVSKRVLPKDMIHFLKTTNDGVNGIGVLTYAKNTIDLSDYTEEAAASYFNSGCNIKGVLKTNGPLNPKQRKDVLLDWSNTYGNDGSSKSGGIVALPGNMEYQAISSNATDAQLLETRLFNLQEIARFFNISPVMLGDLSNSSYSTIEATNLQFLTQTLQPIISLMEHELNRKLLTEEERKTYVIDIDETYLMKGDKAATASYYGTLVEKGIISINEARHQLGLSPVEGGDDLHIAYSDVNQNNVGNKPDNESDENKDDDKTDDEDKSVENNKDKKDTDKKE